MAKAWSEVEKSTAYQALAPTEQLAAKQEYFNSVVVPKQEYQQLPPQEQLAAKTEFMGSMPTLENQNSPKMVMTRSGKMDFANPMERIKAESDFKKSNRVLTMGENTKVAGADDVLGFVQELKDMYKNKTATWGAEGTAELRRIPVVGGLMYAGAGLGKGGESRQNFSDVVENLNNRLLYLRSGAQINDKEFQRLTRLMPSIYRKNTLDVKQLGRFESEFQNIKSRIEKGVRWSGKGDNAKLVSPDGSEYNPESNSNEEIDLDEIFK